VVKRRYYDWVSAPMALRMYRSRQLATGEKSPLNDPQFADELESFASEDQRKAWRDRLLHLRRAS
jgi:hypothetical protein